MSHYAVVDTNVLVSAILSKKADSATVKVIRAIVEGKITPLMHKSIIDEYKEVLRRDKFRLRTQTILRFLCMFELYGTEVEPVKTDEAFSDPDDRIFYEVALAKPNSYLITGNQRHYPIRNFVVSPAQMIDILENNGREN